jgi:23S rRNA (uridine2479-2'-O)-methyltransferase
MTHIKITKEDAEYQIIESLKTNRTKRAKHKEIYIEGIQAIKQALSAKMEFTGIITVDENKVSDWAKNFIANNKKAKLVEMTDELYKKLCDREEPTEIVATAKIKTLALENINLNKKPFVLIFDRPSDYGNFGSILRSANSFNVDAVFVVGHGIDYYDPKVIRSSLGAVFHTPIVNIESMEQLSAWIKTEKAKSNIQIVGTDSTGTVSLIDNDLKTPIALILGNEAKGMSVALQEVCDYITKIPISGDVNCLNVSCAGSIFLWDIYKNSRVQ